MEYVDAVMHACRQRSLAFLAELDKLDCEGKIELLAETFLRVYASESDKYKPVV